MAVGLSHGGPNVFASDHADNHLLVATIDGIDVVRRNGGAWQVVRRTLEGKHISAIMIEPSRGIVFAGTHGDGLFASDDGGRTWQRRDAGIESGNVYALNYTHARGQLRLYAGTEPAHLYVSADLGHGWRELLGLLEAATTSRWTFPAPPHVAHVKNINFDPRSADTIYAAVEQGGLYKSTDAGNTFRELSGFDDDVHRIAIPASQPDHVYITTGVGTYHSTDGGEAWEQLTTRRDRIAYPDALIVHPDRAGSVFTAGAKIGPGAWRTTHTADARIGRSHDGGKTWEMLAGGLPDHTRGNVEAMSMNRWPGGFALFAGTTDGDVFYSNDEGESWTTIVNGLPPVSKSDHYRLLQPEPLGRDVARSV